jgi:hypothetical protein
MGVCHSLKAATRKSATEGRDWILDHRGPRSLVDKCSKCSFVNGFYICDLAILNGYLSSLWGYNKDIA